MLNFLPAPLLGAIAFLLLALNVLFWVPVLLVFAVVRLILPFKIVRLAIDPLLVKIAEAWISGNSGWMMLTQRTAWDVAGVEGGGVADDHVADREAVGDQGVGVAHGLPPVVKTRSRRSGHANLSMAWRCR